MKKLNNKGFGKKETMICLLLIIIGMVAVLYFTTEADDSTKFTKFVHLAKEFGEEAGVVRDTEGPVYETKVYLYDVINLGYNDKYESPFNNGEECNLYESKIEMEDKDIYISMRCSEYYIYRSLSTDEEFSIYKVSEWTDQKLTGSNVQTATFYNYTVNGEEQLDKYYIDKEFIVEYTAKAGYRTVSAGNLRPEHTLVQKTYYRTMEEVA